ncbi:hypothetical protein M422DRAFT_34373 [Sphaerobolus stellatus SS14]|uniref:L-rhamnose mutarotase n=1 Tax=Sphaerobolus stellatus (strain SS14) TaxID=990650 RepID=A0A0C9VF66_SPHS4|nr:hypothetical protein M422DRAFT_34373 [Sphaerobolus stellatus SS14]
MSSSKSNAFLGKRNSQVSCHGKEYLEEYKEIHSKVWGTVLDGLRRSNIVDYSIHFLPSPPFALKAGAPSTSEIGGLLIGTFKYIGNEFEEDMKRTSEDEEIRRWWKITDTIQQTLVEGATSSEGGDWWYPCEEVFRFEK